MGGFRDDTYAARQQIEVAAARLGHRLNRWNGGPNDRYAYCAKCRKMAMVYFHVDEIQGKEEFHCKGEIVNDIRNNIRCEKAWMR